MKDTALKPVKLWGHQNSPRLGRALREAHNCALNPKQAQLHKTELQRRDTNPKKTKAPCSYSKKLKVSKILNIGRQI